MSKVDWSKAPEWATCVVIRSINKFSTEYHWSEKPMEGARMMKIETGANFLMSNPTFWTIVEHRPVDVTSKTMMNLFDWSKAPDWATCVVVPANFKLSNEYFWSEEPKMYARMMKIEEGVECTMKMPACWEIVEERPMEPQPSSPCAFTPADQPSNAPELLNRAAELLAERGKQYDKSGEERSAAAIVAAFNIITKRDLTPGEGWLFMVLLKAVRFYSNTETPHRDSLEDMIAFAALHAEEYLNDK